MSAWLGHTLDEALDDWRRLTCATLAFFLVGAYDDRVAPQLAAGLIAYLVVGALDDLGHLVRSLHECVHDAADEACLKMLKASEEAARETRSETQAQQ